MLDSDTKQKIDSLRNILVGKIPNPQSQVEQITTGLIYKFMHDMDQESIEMGGEGSFFVGDYEKYSWNNLFDTKLSGVDKVKLYSDAIEGMYLNPSAPELFRNIFKNAFLPFKDPSTLNMFLKEVNEFHYSHSEKLGDAFEYLISIMGSQGDAGQFRTPRHIIDFIVEIINPQKHETVLDPACGTGGFLISSYKHILKTNTDKKSGDLLSASDRKKVGENIGGYDISPEMIKLSLVNMYLHGFSTPDIEEYDTLSSEDKWNEYYDVILANPPFFSPSGGIQPHKRFGVESKKAEVLFASYILEHLKPNGRAGIIIPEGIIFQNGKAYKELRKQLIENGLVGVISLPAGVFKPYSGVKTSILILDKKLYKDKDSIFFGEVKNDGFSLTENRTPIKDNDLPKTLNNFIKNDPEYLLSKEEILNSVDYNLSFSRYKQESLQNSEYEKVRLNEIMDLQNGYAFKSKDYVEKSETLNFRMSQIRPDGSVDLEHNPKFLNDSFKETYKEYKLQQGDVVIAMTDMASDPKILGIPSIVPSSDFTLLMNQRVGKFNKIDQSKIHKSFLGWVLKTNLLKKYYVSLGSGGLQLNISKKDILAIQIPLPPLEVQQEIVDELEGYQKIIDGCKQVVENYKPTIDIDPSWGMVELRELCSLITKGTTPKTVGFDFQEDGINFVKVESISSDGEIIKDKLGFVSSDCHSALKRSQLEENDILFSIAGTLGRTAIISREVLPANTNQALGIIRLKDKTTSRFVLWCLSSGSILRDTLQKKVGVAQFNLSLSNLNDIRIPIPPKDIQKEIVKKIEEERKVIEGNKKLIEIYTQKIQDRINKVWGED